MARMAIHAYAPILIIFQIVTKRCKGLIAEFASFPSGLLLLRFRRVSRTPTRIALRVAHAQRRGLGRKHDARWRREVAQYHAPKVKIGPTAWCGCGCGYGLRCAVLVRRMFSTGLRSFGAWHGLIGSSATAPLSFQSTDTRLSP